MRVEGTDAHLLDPEQWVNVYRHTPFGAQFYGVCQVKNLEDFCDEYVIEFGLELVDDVE